MKRTDLILISEHEEDDEEMQFDMMCQNEEQQEVKSELNSQNPESGSQLESEPDEDEDLGSNSKDGNDGELLSESMDLDSKDENDGEEQSDLMGLDKEQKEVESEFDSQDQDDGKMQCESDRQEKEDEQMPYDVNVDGGASLPNGASSSLLSAEEEVTRTLLVLNTANFATEQGNPTTDIRESVPRACTCSTNAKFEGYDVRSDSPNLAEDLGETWEHSRKHHYS